MMGHADAAASSKKEPPENGGPRFLTSLRDLLRTLTQIRFRLLLSLKSKTSRKFSLSGGLRSLCHWSVPPDGGSLSFWAFDR